MARPRTRVSRQQAARYLAHCNSELAKPDLPDERRARLLEHREFYRKALVGSCTKCGRELSDPRSLELGIGPECAAKLDQADADDREYDRAVDHELRAS